MKQTSVLTRRLGMAQEARILEYHLYTENVGPLDGYVRRYFDSFTIAPTDGYFRGDRERSVDITILAPVRDFVLVEELARDIKIGNRQHSVLLTVGKPLHVQTI